MTGTVYKSTGSWYWVKSENTLYKCRIKGKFRIKGIKSTNPLAVGDKVDFSLETNNNEETGVINKIHERDNYIVRKSVNLSKQTHIIAANIDQVFLLITIDNPPTFTTFIDRFLVTAEAYSIKTVLVFNKIDSYEIEQKAEILYLKDIYEAIGYECIEVSATENINVDKIKDTDIISIDHNGTKYFAVYPKMAKLIFALYSNGQNIIHFADDDLTLATKILKAIKMTPNYIQKKEQLFAKRQIFLKDYYGTLTKVSG